MENPKPEMLIVLSLKGGFSLLKVYKGLYQIRGLLLHWIDAIACLERGLLMMGLIDNIINVLKFCNTSCPPKKPRQTRQTQIRLLLEKQSDQCLPCLLI